MINTVCLCGSTRFLDDFHTANVELTKRAFSVITISMALPKGADENPGLKMLLDLVHLNKILRSDAIFVVGDGYVGQSTAREIIWADMHDKTVISQYMTDSWDKAAKLLQRASLSQLPEIVARARRVLEV